MVSFAILSVSVCGSLDILTVNSFLVNVYAPVVEVALAFSIPEELVLKNCSVVVLIRARTYEVKCEGLNNKLFGNNTVYSFFNLISLNCSSDTSIFLDADNVGML